MITVYKQKPSPRDMELIMQNDIFFNKHTAMRLDNAASDIIAQIDHTTLLSPYAIRSRFDGMTLNIDKLSTGCKTTLNIMYNTDKVFDIRECGDNALDVIYHLPKGNVYCDYPLISFDMDKVNVYDNKGLREIDSYDDLKVWWNSER